MTEYFSKEKQEEYNNRFRESIEDFIANVRFSGLSVDATEDTLIVKLPDALVKMGFNFKRYMRRSRDD